MVWSISKQKHVHTLRGHVDEIEVLVWILLESTCISIS